MSQVTCIILAGDNNTERNMAPLTNHRAMPAIPVGAVYRLIDFAMSNLLNSGINRIFVLSQRYSYSLMNYMQRIVPQVVATRRDQFIRFIAPKRQENGRVPSEISSLVELRHYIEEVPSNIFGIIRPNLIAKINFRKAVERLYMADSDGMAIYARVDPRKSRPCNIFSVDGGGWINDWQENPSIEENSQTDRGDIEAFFLTRESFSAMLDYLSENEPAEPQAFSHMAIPWLIREKKIIGYDFIENDIPEAEYREKRYLRLIQFPDEWFGVQMELCRRNSELNLFSDYWPIMAPLPKLVAETHFDSVYINEALFGFNVICQDSTEFTQSIIGTGAHIGKGSRIYKSIIMPGAKLGNDCLLDNVVVEKEIKVPNGTSLSASMPPPNTISEQDLRERLAKGQVDNLDSLPCLTNNRILIFPKGYKF